jgi:hypothetical protein
MKTLTLALALLISSVAFSQSKEELAYRDSLVVSYDYGWNFSLEILNLSYAEYNLNGHYNKATLDLQDKVMQMLIKDANRLKHYYKKYNDLEKLREINTKIEDEVLPMYGRLIKAKEGLKGNS